MRAFKNNISIILITFLIPIISYSQKHQQVKPDGHIIEKQFNVNTYHGLNMAAMGKVYLTDGKVGEIKIKGDENIIELLNLKVINQVLNIDFKSPVSFNGEFELKIYVPINTLKSIDLSSVSSIEGEKTIKTDDFKLNISGVCNIDLTLDVQKLKINMDGVSHGKLSGKAQEMTIEKSGVGLLNAIDLTTQKASLIVDGIEGVKITVEKELDVQISGLSYVKYKGNPKIIRKKVDQLAKLKKI